MKTTTARLPKGQSYPLKPSSLKAAFASAGIALDTMLIRAPGVLFDAHFWPPKNGIPQERLYIRAGSVPSSRAADARHRVEAVLIPALIAWIAAIMREDPKSPRRREKQSIDLRLD